MNGQEETVLPPTDCVDLYVDVVCHVECAISHGRHIQLWTVLPHTTFHFHSFSRHTTCTYILTWQVYMGTVTYWPSCTVTESRKFVHIMCNVWWTLDTVGSKGTLFPMEDNSKFKLTLQNSIHLMKLIIVMAGYPSFI